MKSGNFVCKKRAPTSKFREVPVGKRMMPPPTNFSGTFHGAIATYSNGLKHERVNFEITKVVFIVGSVDYYLPSVFA